MERTIMYDRQAELVDVPWAVHVIGCGGVGTWAAIFLALSGVGHLHLYEDDIVEESNLNRLPYTAGAIGKPKIELLAEMLHELRPDIELTLHGRFQPLLHTFLPRQPVIGAVDTMSDRQTIYRACQEQEAYYIDVGAEAHSCTVSDSPADWSLVEDSPGYFTPIWIAPVVMAAALAVSAAVFRSMGHRETDTVILNLRNLRKEAANEQE